MKFGICLPNYGASLSKQAVVESAQLAENLGYDSVWTTDHILVPAKHADPYGNILDSLVTLAYLGAVTEKIHLGTSVLVLPTRNPILIAKQIATIDYLTGGRLILGTAIGWMEEEFNNLGMPFRNRAKRFEEAISLIRALYREGSPKFDGRYHRFTDATFKPSPRGGREPVLWFGGNSDGALLRAARLADGWHPVGVGLEEFKEAAARIRSILPLGKEFTLSLRILVDLEGKAKPHHASSGEPRHVISGSRDQAIETIEKYRDAGLQHLVCFFDDVALETLKGKMKQFADAIMPSFQK